MVRDAMLLGLPLCPGLIEIDRMGEDWLLAGYFLEASLSALGALKVSLRRLLKNNK